MSIGENLHHPVGRGGGLRARRERRGRQRRLLLTKASISSPSVCAA